MIVSWVPPAKVPDPKGEPIVMVLATLFGVQVADESRPPVTAETEHDEPSVIVEGTVTTI